MRAKCAEVSGFISRSLVCVVTFATLQPLSLFAAEPLPVRSKYDLSFYGYIKLDAIYDTQRTVSGNQMFYVMPEGTDARQDEFNLTANESRLGLNIRVPDVEMMDVAGKLEMDFYGGGSENAPNVRLRLAYVDFDLKNWALRAGQDWDTLILVGPRFINFPALGHTGALGARRPQLRLSRVVQLAGETRLIAKVAAARTIGRDLDGGGQDDGAAAGYPSMQASLALETRRADGRNLIAGISGHAGTETVCASVDETCPDNPVYVDEKDYDSWSLIGSLRLPLTRCMMLQGTIWCGENLATYSGGIGQGINGGRQTGIAAHGGWVQIVLDPVVNWNVNIGYGVDNPDSRDLNAGQRKNNEVIFGSIFHNLTSAVTLACEYLHMTTSYKDGANASNDRVQAAVIFRF